MTNEQLQAAKQRAQAAQKVIQEQHPDADLMAFYWLAFSPWNECSASYCLYLIRELEAARKILHALRLVADGNPIPLDLKDYAKKLLTDEDMQEAQP